MKLLLLWLKSINCSCACICLCISIIFPSNFYFISSLVFLWISINRSSNVSFTCESFSTAFVNFCSTTTSNSWTFSSWVARVPVDHLLLVEPKIEIGVGPNPYPQTCPCLFRPITWVYISSTDVDVTDDVEVADYIETVDDVEVVEEDIPLDWDSTIEIDLKIKKKKLLDF